jgi:hypothetical protein
MALESSHGDYRRDYGGLFFHRPVRLRSLELKTEN